jgi:hypothetical protein
MLSRMKKATVLAAMLAVSLVFNAAAAVYGVVLLNDGTYTWLAATNGTNQMTISANGSPAALTIDYLGGPLVPYSTVALLPSCTAALKGAVRMVTDATTPTYNAALTGGGAVIVPVACSGAAWTSH